jgi:hypothetical protein
MARSALVKNGALTPFVKNAALTQKSPLLVLSATLGKSLVVFKQQLIESNRSGHQTGKHTIIQA